ncbi:D-isomer specific 2-hydroxyacid dehydrogenase [Stachybotrys elegans]|uniref:D-isomer specific 2-hydroxyacid dehydrogenase n=1 Tax=Stachybotrys elegans TaxID=80388 RepID=A0A8K0SJV9_9HYPO|nr:D-isomer specific 2-hydroxyacid dehydrogenase [Stachybotrys elegans]
MGSGKPTVYLLDSFHPEALKYCQKRFNAILPGDPGHANWRQDAKYLLVRSSYVTAEDVAQSPKLKAIGKQGVGIDKIDAKACEGRGIKIFNTPGVNARAVAETVVALTMGVAREIPRIVTEQSHGTPVPKETCSGLIIHKKTIGLLGMGNIGHAVAHIFRHGFAAEIVTYDPFMPADAWSDIPHRRVETVEEVLRASDVLSIHVPLTAQTKNMISYPQLQMMKPTAILINAARGGIVNEADLEKGLEEGLIWGAGLDCHEQEPPTKERYGKLWNSRVLSTPHIGAATSQTQMETAIAAVQRLYEFVQSQEE